MWRGFLFYAASFSFSFSFSFSLGTKTQTHQRQVLRGGLLDRGSQVGVEVYDVLEVEAELRRVLVEGVAVF